MLTSWTQFRSVFWWGAQILSRNTRELTSESSSRAPGGLSRADSLPGTGKQKPCHKKWMELDSVASSAALVPSGHAWNADCLFTGLAWEAMEAQKGRAGRVWQECPSAAHSKCRSPVLSLGAELYWLQGLQEHGGQVCRLWYFCCR